MNATESLPRTVCWQVREWTPDDLAMVNAWRSAHGVSSLPLNLIPPLAVIAERDGEPMAFAACYLCPPREGGAPVALFEWLTTKDGLSLKRARRGLSHAIACLREMLSKGGGALCLAYCGGALSHEAQLMGFMVAGEPVRMHCQNAEPS